MSKWKYLFCTISHSVHVLQFSNKIVDIEFLRIYENSPKQSWNKYNIYNILSYWLGLPSSLKYALPNLFWIFYHQFHWHSSVAREVALERIVLVQCFRNKTWKAFLKANNNLHLYSRFLKSVFSRGYGAVHLHFLKRKLNKNC